MSDYYLCNFCTHDHWTFHKHGMHTWECDRGEPERKVMHDCHNGMRCDEPTDVCPHYVRRRDS